MKAVVICRTRNESINIDRFCQANQWADWILIADGGSDDLTVKKALAYPNVKVRGFYERVEHNDYWRNPHGKHINFMIDWALDEGADWIMFDDCDCVPTIHLQRSIRGILEETDKRVIHLYRLYVWEQNEYFPALNKPGKSLWGWHKSIPVRALEDDPWSHNIVPTWQKEDVLYLDHPLSCLHYFCPTPEITEMKLNFYRESREIPYMRNPRESCGRLEALPEWAVWE